jgi:TetR/AcrR family transcriptional repressor of nem operon
MRFKRRAYSDDQVIQRIADLITLSEQEDSVQNFLDAFSLAQVIYQMWLGAALLSKLQKDKAPLYKALKATESLLNIEVA